MTTGETNVTATAFEDDDPTEPIAAVWESDVPVSSVVYKAGNPIYVVDAGSETSRSVTVGDGEVSDDVSPSEPCPAGSELVAKWEWRGNEFREENDDERGGGGILPIGLPFLLGLGAVVGWRRRRQ